MTRACLTSIVRHELRMLRRSRAAAIVWPVLVIVIACAMWNGQRWTDRQRATATRVLAANEERYHQIYTELADLARRNDPRPPLQLAGMAWYIFQPEGAPAPAPHLDPRRPEAAASEWVGARHVVLPPRPLAALATGQSDLHPYYARVTIRTRPVLVQSDELENPANLLNGRFDAAFVLLFCWPLLVLPLLYNVLSEDRENGTLALIGSQPISLRTLLAVRLALRASIAILLTVGTSAVALIALAGPSVSFSDITTWTLAVAAIGLFWTGVAAMVNLSRWQSAMNATALTGIWMALVVMAPAAIDRLASTIVPVPSRVELVNAIRDAANLSSAQLAALISEYYEEHPDASPASQAADVGAVRGLAQQDALDRRIDPILDRYHRAVAQRQALVDRLRFVSPPLLAYDAILELAGTSTSRFRRFAGQVDAYHRDWRAYFYPLVRARASMTKDLYETAPRFIFREEPHRETTLRAFELIGTVMLCGAVLFALALVRIKRGVLG